MKRQFSLRKVKVLHIPLTADTVFTLVSVYELSCALEVFNFLNDYAHYHEGEQMLLKGYLTRHHDFFITLAA